MSEQNEDWRARALRAEDELHRIKCVLAYVGGAINGMTLWPWGRLKKLEAFIAKALGT